MRPFNVLVRFKIHSLLDYSQKRCKLLVLTDVDSLSFTFSYIGAAVLNSVSYCLDRQKCVRELHLTNNNNFILEFVYLKFE